MMIALLVAARIKEPKKVGTFLSKGKWTLVGGDDIGKKDNNLKSQFSPPLGSTIEIESSGFYEVEIDNPDDDEIFLFFQSVPK